MRERFTETEIDEATGYANGDLWGNEEEIREYFNLRVMREISNDPEDYPYSQDDLDHMADIVIEHGWHMVKK